MSEPTADQVKPATESEKVWLIERYNTPGGQASWLCVEGSYGHDPTGAFVWRNDAWWALRFSRERDAQLFIGALLNLQENLPHKLTISYFRRGDPTPTATEHIFLNEPNEVSP